MEVFPDCQLPAIDYIRFVCGSHYFSPAGAGQIRSGSFLRYFFPGRSVIGRSQSPSQRLYCSQIFPRYFQLSKNKNTIKNFGHHQYPGVCSIINYLCRRPQLPGYKFLFPYGQYRDRLVYYASRRMARRPVHPHTAVRCIAVSCTQQRKQDDFVNKFYRERLRRDDGPALCCTFPVIHFITSRFTICYFILAFFAV